MVTSEIEIASQARNVVKKILTLPSLGTFLMGIASITMGIILALGGNESFRILSEEDQASVQQIIIGLVFAGKILLIATIINHKQCD